YAQSGGQVPAIYGLNTNIAAGVMGQGGQYGVRGYAPNGYGVYGQSTSSHGVFGTSGTEVGVYGLSNTGSGVYGGSSNGYGVYGLSTDRKSTRLNSSHVSISYAVFCLK